MTWRIALAGTATVWRPWSGQESSWLAEISVVSPQGELLFESLLKPSCRIEPAARAIHGHSAKSLSEAPCFFEVYADLLEVLYKRRVIVFDASYDRRVWDA